MLRAKDVVLRPRLTSTDVKKRILLLKRQHAKNSGFPKGGADLTLPARPGPRPRHIPKHAIPNSQGRQAHPKGHARVDVPTWTKARPRPAVAAVPEPPPRPPPTTGGLSEAVGRETHSLLRPVPRSRPTSPGSVPSQFETESPRDLGSRLHRLAFGFPACGSEMRVSWSWDGLVSEGARPESAPRARGAPVRRRRGCWKGVQAPAPLPALLASWDLEPPPPCSSPGLLPLASPAPPAPPPRRVWLAVTSVGGSRGARGRAQPTRRCHWPE